MQFLNYSNVAPPLSLSSGVTAAATTLTVSATAGYPEPPFLIGMERGTVNEEVVLCTAVTATTFTVERGYDGTTAKTHGTGTLIEHTVAALVFRGSGIVRLTEAQRDALAGDNVWDGRVIFNIDASALQMRIGTDWVAVLLATGATMFGELDMARNLLTAPKVQDFSETVNPRGTVTTTLPIDYSLGNVVTATLGGNAAVTFTNVPADGGAITLITTQDATGGRVPTFPASVDWPNQTVPTPDTSPNAVNIYAFLTPDGGTTWYGFLSGKGMG